MNYDNLPIYKSSLDLCVYIEIIVKTFEKYNKYIIGEYLRTKSKEILFLIYIKTKQSRLRLLRIYIKSHYALTRKRVINNFKYKKEELLDRYEHLLKNTNQSMKLKELKKFLSLLASYKGHISHSSSYKLYHSPLTIKYIE